MDRRAALLPVLLTTSCLSLSTAPEIALPRVSVLESAPPSSAEARSGAPVAGRSAPSRPVEESWTFALSPYLFASGLEGTVGVGPATEDIEAEFDDLLGNLSMGAMLEFEAAPPASPWTFMTNLMYVELEENGTTKGPMASPVSTTIEQFIGELAAAYEVHDAGRLELLAGLRYWSLSTGLNADTPSGPQGADVSRDWLDPLVGLRSRIQLVERFDLFLRGDMGGFGMGSDFSYNLGAGVFWTVSRVVQLALGYRYLYVDYDSDGFRYDMAQSGPLLGIAFQF